MENRRQIKADLVSYIREDWLLRKGLYTNYSGIPLQRSINPDTSVVYKNDLYFNFVYYVPSDILGVTYPPVIYDGGVSVNPANYTIHYQYGEVTFSTPPTGAVTADFAMLYYSVLDQDDLLFDRKDAPFSYIVIRNLTCREEGLQLAGGVYQNFDFILEIASYYRKSPTVARARTDDLVEMLKRGLKYIPIIDYTTNLPLDADGDRVTAYNRVTQDDNKRYSLIEQSVVDMEIPSYEDTREIAQHSVSFTLTVAADTT